MAPPQQKRTSDKLNFYIDQVNQDRNNPIYRDNLGWAFFEEGLNNKAVEQFKSALKLNSKDNTALYNLALVYTKLGDYRMSKTYLARLLQINPNHLLAHYKIAEAYLGLRDYQKAKDHLKTYLRADPTSQNALIKLGECYEGLKQPQKALAAYKLSLMYVPNDAKVQNKIESLEVISNHGRNKS